MDPKIGLITVPLMVLGLVLRDHGAAPKFRRAGAVSPATAIRPDRVGMERRFLLESDLRSGLLIERNGRYFVDETVWRRHRRRKIAFAILTGLVLASLAVVAVTRGWF